MATKKTLYLWLAVLLFSCNNTEREAYGASAEVFYREYTIWGEEDKENVKVFLQFRKRNREGDAIVLEEPAKLMLDGVELQSDSAASTGIFYETQIPLARFAGEHTIKFTDFGKKEYVDTFRFTPFRLVSSLGNEVNQTNLLLEFEGLQNGDQVRVVATDTSYTSEGINGIFLVQNGQIDLEPIFRTEIKSGPVVLQLFKEEDRFLKNGMHAGRISITYGLKREFELKD